MRYTDSIIPVKKTQSKFLDQLIQQQCTVNERNRVIYEQTMHLKNSMISGDSNARHNHYYSQTASSQAKKKIYGKSTEQIKPKQQRKQRKSTTLLTQPKAFQFHASARSSRTKQQTKNQTTDDQNQANKILYSSNAKPVNINKDASKRSKSVSGIAKPRAHLTKIVGFSFATDSRFQKASKNQETEASIEQPKNSKSFKPVTRRSSRRLSYRSSGGEQEKRKDSHSFRRQTHRSSFLQSKKSTQSQQQTEQTKQIKRTVSKPKQTFRAFKQSFSRSTLSTDNKNVKETETNKRRKSSSIVSRQTKNSTRRGNKLSTITQSRSRRHTSMHTKNKVENKQTTKPKARRSITKRASTFNQPIKKHSRTRDTTQISDQSANESVKTDQSKPKQKRKRRLSLTESQMKKMLNKQISSTETTDWNKIYVQANRKRSRSLTRSSSRSSLSHRSSNDINGNSRRRRGRSASFNSVKYADFVENYALDALLTDDASRISDEDLKELSRTASENNSPVHSSEYSSFGSDLTFAQLLDHDMNMLSSELIDDRNINSTVLDASNTESSKNGTANTNSDDEQKDEDVITDVKDRFLKLDHLFGQISAAIEEGEDTWIHS